MKLEFYNPSGKTETTARHADRLPSLSGKRIGFLSNGDWQAFRSLPLLIRHLREDFHDVDILPLDTFPEGTDFIAEDATIEAVKRSGVDAVVIGNAACGACSTACALAAGRLEAIGIPTVTITREEFVPVVCNAVSGLGLPPDLAIVTFPLGLFTPDSDLSPLSERRREIYYGLTSWVPRDLDGAEDAIIAIECRDYEEGLRTVNHLFQINRWGDGLPMWPATRERVEWILRGTDLPRDHLLGKFPPRGGLATVEACAISLAMAGGRPEYLCILIAAVEAILDPKANAEHEQATSAGTFPVVIVNGPIGKQVRMNSGFGCLGPDAQHPAGASIGRALRQLQQNLGGALPGSGTMAPWGAMRYTNAVFAEDEENLPEGWLPHGTERHGFAPGTNSISFFWATGATNIVRRSATDATLQEDVLQGLHRMAGFLAAPSVHYINGYTEGTPGAILLTKVVAKYLAMTGWTKEKTRRFLWENSKISRDVLQRNGCIPWFERGGDRLGRESVKLDPWPIASKPENLILVVAGGGHPTHAFWLQAIARNVVGRKVAAPHALDDLLGEAGRDLGCGSDACMI
ncbi:hypothetical protein [Variovorax sp. Sphag1AA]|uniref:UGSC family (seleno)protein n=1 Tax=Variovorax sp. Sphag1AA TaxID=2587027 RepID=UPI001C85CEFA|nr:hypothetical protein [Variovorax sp. Sphag1AA]